MSIAIKGMDMPTSCSRCPCSNDASRFCRVVEEYIPMLGKPAFCPLVDVPDTNVGDMISRQAAIDAVNDLTKWYYETYHEKRPTAVAVIDKLIDLPSAQPGQDEWCTDCKEYDSEKHCCPRFNRVIRNALKDAQPEKKGKWIVHPEVKNVYGGTYIECSQCGEKYVVQHMEDEKYCRNCGAKMEV